MAEQPTAVFLKQSGELLAKKSEGKAWHAYGVRAVGEKLARVQRLSGDLNIDGITLVSGAGNVVRGDKLREDKLAGDMADFMGRLATVQNTVIVAAELEKLEVPVEIFLTDKMQIGDPSFRPTKYSAEQVRQAHADGRIALIAGGTGEDNVTTDNAVVFYAHDYQTVDTEHPVTILKGTKHDGIFEWDPEEVPSAQRYKRISAHTMLEDHERYKAVDITSLESLIKYELSMVVYSDGVHDLDTVLRNNPSYNGNGGNLGTLIVPEVIDPEIAA